MAAWATSCFSSSCVISFTPAQPCFRTGVIVERVIGHYIRHSGLVSTTGGQKVTILVRPTKQQKTMTQQYVDMINAAPVYDVAIHSPLDPAPRLSERLANTVLLKREDLQQVFSFKLRGAYNRIIHLSEEERRCGVIAASAGNHAQGVALAAQRLGIKATIVMPKTTPEIKQHAVKSLGATTVLHGNAYDDAYRHAMELVENQGLTFIHPYDDPLVIAGQGTIGKELLAQRESIDAIFVPVGGGGLIAGIAAYVKIVRPDIRIIGVEPEDAPSMYTALRDNERVRLDQVGIFADGVAVRQVGEEPFRLAREYVDEVVLVTTDEICAAIKDIFDDTRSITEPAGALAVAGLKKYVAEKSVQGQTLIAVDSGANMNFDRLRHVAERAELGERRELLFAATIPERPGSFRQFCETIGTRGITEFNYRYADPGEAHIFVGVQLHGGEQEKQALFGQLDAAGYPYMDMSDNEMAKLHIRYMVGGRVDGVKHECLYRFEFPERPGALLRFLNHMGAHWNISLFHYRNHGADYGRVLVGMQVPPEEEPMLQRFLDEIGYRYWDETGNPANALFLSGTTQ
ncbi:MAG: threonine ammonia-lyase, biosynthetic [Thiohalophilus sp.]